MTFNKISHPIIFQGNRQGKNYFEGWYYKHVSRDEKTVVSFIPGVSFATDDAHSFVQYIYVSLDEKNRKTIKTGYFRYPLEDFVASDKPFLIRVADNYFSESEIAVKLSDDNINVEGTLKFGSLLLIKKSILMPNIMGFFAYVPKMECYHGIISMNHILHGKLTIDQKEIDFDEGKGYIEKDWGTSFPKRYIWIQCNNFKNKNTSVFLSMADIPFMGKSFFGHICNLIIDDHEYRFATYNKSKLKVELITDQKLVLSFEKNKAILRIEANLSNTGDLIAPQKGRMENITKEGLSGEVKISIWDKQREIAYEDNGTMAGIEISGF